MGRSYIVPKQQPDDYTCGPAAVKHALEIFGKRKSIKTLSQLCRTNYNGTTTKNIINAFKKLGYPVIAVERASLRHVQSALKHKPGQERAALVTYLYDLKENDMPHPDSGHWAVVGSYSSRNGRIILIDSATGKKKSYQWNAFRDRWKDYDLKRKTNSDGSVELVKKWQHQLLLVVAREEKHLPKFSIKTQKIYLPN